MTELKAHIGAVMNTIVSQPLRDSIASLRRELSSAAALLDREHPHQARALDEIISAETALRDAERAFVQVERHCAVATIEVMLDQTKRNHVHP